MICLECDSVNDGHRRFCRSCGRALTQPCARCSFPNGQDDAFCGGCGSELAHPAPSPAPRRAPAAASPAPAASRLSPSQLGALLAEARPKEAPLPAKLSQDDLDKLFGGET